MKNLRVSPQALIWIIAAVILSVSPFFFGGTNAWGRAILLWGVSCCIFLLAFIKITPGKDRWWLRTETAWACFLMIAALSLFRSPVIRESLEHFALLFAGAAVFFIARTLKGDTAKSRFFFFLMLAGIALAAWSLWGFLTNNLGIRMPGPFRNPDGLGPALLLPAALAAGFWRQSRTRSKKIFAALASFFLASCILLTSSVATILGLLFGAALLWLFLGQRPQRRTVVITILVAALSFGIALGLRTIQNDAKVSTDLNLTTGIQAINARTSIEQRVSFLRTSLAMAQAHPVLGVGLGLWSSHFPRFTVSTLERSELAHGILPQYLGELGWLGLAFFLYLSLSIVRALLRSARRHSTPLLRSATLGTLGLLAAACVDIAWFYPSLFFLFCFVAGILSTDEETLGGDQSQPGWKQKALLLFCAFVLLGWTSIRFLSTHWTDAADTSAQGQRDRIDALATAKLAFDLAPSPSEELKLSIIKWVFSYHDEDKVELRSWTERTLRDDPLQPATYLLLGRIEMREGNRDRAETLFRQGLALDPYFVPDLAGDLTELLMLQGKNQEAIDLANAQLARTGPYVPDGKRSLAKIAVLKASAQLALEDRDGAHASLLQALELDPDNAEAHTGLQQEFNETR